MNDDLGERLARLGSSDDIDELLDLGCEFSDAGRQDDAERCFRHAAELGSAVGAFDLGNTLSKQLRCYEAVAAYEQALAGGETDAWLNLGQVLEELDDVAGAMRAYVEGSRVGDSNATLSLAFFLREQLQPGSATEQAEAAAAAGNLTAKGVVACWRWCSSLDPALEPLLREGADHFASARADLADLLRATGRVPEAQSVLEHGAELGEVESWLALGKLYVDEIGDEAAAEVAYRGGISAGDSYCHHNLGVLLQGRGDLDAAEQEYRLGAAAGDALAASALRELLDDEA